MSEMRSSNLIAVSRLHARMCSESNGKGWGQIVSDLEAACSEIDRLTARVAELEKERDEWAQKAHDWRAKYAELRYPGMKGVVHTAGAADETAGEPGA